MSKRGRPRLPVELHIARGTYRADRHGPRPVDRPVPAGFIRPAAARLDGELPFTCELLETWAIDDPASLAHARAAGAAKARREALDLTLDGASGLLARLAAGDTTVTAKAVEVLLKARQQAADEFSKSMAALDLAMPAAARAVVR